MYTALIEDQPEKRSRGKSVFTFPLVLLFILVGVASTRHLLNVNGNNDLESMLAETSEDIVPEDVGETDLANKKCTGWWCIHNCVKVKECKVVMTLDLGSGGTKPSLWAIKQAEDVVSGRKIGIPDIHRVGTDENPNGHKFKPICGIWIDKNRYQGDKQSFCKDHDNSPTLEGKLRKLKSSCFRSKKPKSDQEIDQCKGERWSCSDLYVQKLGQKSDESMEEFARSESTGDYYDRWIKHFENQMTCFLNTQLKSDGDSMEPIQNYISGIFGGATAGLRNDPETVKTIGGLEKVRKILNNAPKPTKEAREERCNLDGDCWRSNIRMLSGEEEGYYEWLGFNWKTLGKFTKQKPLPKEFKNTFTIGGASAQISIPTEKPMSTLDNTYYFQIGEHKYWLYTNSIMWGGTTRLTNMVKKYAKSFDEDFPFDIQRLKPVLDKEGNQRLEKGKKMFATAAINLNEVKVKGKDRGIMDMFFEVNNKLLCADICNNQKCKDTQLYKGLCVMGFHLPDLNQWITKQFVGNADYSKLVGEPQEENSKPTNNVQAGCLKKIESEKSSEEEESETPPVKIDLGFNEACDDPKKYNSIDRTDLDDKGWWNQNKPTVSLPFYGRFWKQLLTDAGVSEQKVLTYSKGKDIDWSAIWAATWLHGQFQGFPNPLPVANNPPGAAAKKTPSVAAKNTPDSTPIDKSMIDKSNFRRNLAELKGEYTLGPLTIPAHFGTPEDEQ